MRTYTAPSPRAVARRALRPPLRDRRFWIVQLLVLAIAAGHEAADVDDFLTPIGVPAFATVGLFLVPIVYAALNFGLTGSLATAAWVTLLTLPDFFVINRAEHHWVDGVQLAIIDAVAVFVGERVERERLARRRAEAAVEAYRRAEARYRALFTSSHAAILVIDPQGVVREANPAAGRLLPEGLAGRPVADVLGAGYAQLSANQVDVVRVRNAHGETRDLRPFCTAIETDEGEVVQLLLHDVTEERREQQRLAAFAGDLMRAQEDERRRIGQDIHDEPLQALIQLYRRLAGAEPAELSAARAEIAGAASLMDRVIANLRELAHGLRPPALDDLGVAAALRRTVDEFGDRNAVEADLAVSGAVRRLPSEVELCLFRIAQEALHNVERHAAARTVHLRLDFDAACVQLEVEDDGIGFDVEAASAGTRSLGLVGMNERAQLVGGTLLVESRPDGGTLVRAALPIAG